jgi:hypothetical protein
VLLHLLGHRLRPPTPSLTPFPCHYTSFGAIWCHLVLLRPLLRRSVLPRPFDASSRAPTARRRLFGCSYGPSTPVRVLLRPLLRRSVLLRPFLRRSVLLRPFDACSRAPTALRRLFGAPTALRRPFGCSYGPFCAVRCSYGSFGAALCSYGTFDAVRCTYGTFDTVCVPLHLLWHSPTPALALLGGGANVAACREARMVQRQLQRCPVC